MSNVKNQSKETFRKEREYKQILTAHVEATGTSVWDLLIDANGGKGIYMIPDAANTRLIPCLGSPIVAYRALRERFPGLRFTELVFENNRDNFSSLYNTLAKEIKPLVVCPIVLLQESNDLLVRRSEYTVYPERKIMDVSDKHGLVYFDPPGTIDHKVIKGIINKYPNLDILIRLQAKSDLRHCPGDEPTKLSLLTEEFSRDNFLVTTPNSLLMWTWVLFSKNEKRLSVMRNTKFADDTLCFYSAASGKGEEIFDRINYTALQRSEALCC